MMLQERERLMQGMGQNEVDINTQIGQEINDRGIKAHDYMCLDIWGKPGGPPTAYSQLPLPNGLLQIRSPS